MPAGKRPRSTPLLGSEGKQLNLESRKSDSIDYATLSVMKGRVQEESESLHHTCETEYFKAIRWRNNFVNVMLKKGLEKGDVVKAREPIGNEYIPEKSGDANGQRGKNLNEKEYMHHCNEVVLHRPSERGLDQKMEMSCSDVRTVIQSEISFSVSRPSTSPLLEISNKRKLNPKYIASSSVQAVDVDKKKSVQTSKRKINAKKVELMVDTEQRVEHDFDICVHARDGEKVSTNQEDQAETKGFPSFESYVVEEEEGSGGYGTVYRV